MGKKLELVGQRFGRLVVREEVGRSNGGHVFWKCECDCGSFTTVVGMSLKSGNTKSCGCLKNEWTVERFRSHGLRKKSTTYGMGKTPTYRSWSGMLQRCRNPNDKRYSDYGGRGITVCDRWLKFENFLEDMGIKPENLTIERINNSQGYSLCNCKWATRTEQARNRRIRKDSSTGVKGVAWSSRDQAFYVRIGVNGMPVYIGYFTNIKDAKIARKEAEQKYWR